MSKTDDTPAADRGSECNDLLGLPPAYLGDGQTAYASGLVASWPAHNQARFRTLLFTGAQLDAAVAAERERCALLVDRAAVAANWNEREALARMIRSGRRVVDAVSGRVE